MTKNRKEKAVKYFERLGLKILNLEDYKNNSTKLHAVDKDGYQVLLSTTNARNNKGYRPFYSSNPYTINNIRRWLELNDPDYELVSTEYKHSAEKLEWRKKSRPDLPNFFSSWHLFYSDGCRHPLLAIERGSNSKRRKPEQVRKDIDEVLGRLYEGWVLDEGEEFNYKTAKHSLLNFTHRDGFRSQSTYAQILNEDQKTLILFHPTYPETSMFNMCLWIERFTKFKMVEGQEYTHFKDKYRFICEEHGEFINNFSTLYSYNTGCEECIYERRFGETNSNWKPHLTEDERVHRYNRTNVVDGYNRWVRLSK